MLPFTAEQFAATFARYNEAVWPSQVVLTLLGTAAIVALLRGESARRSRAIAAILALFWAWMAGAYHLAFFAAINPAAPLFAALFLAAAAALAWHGVVRGDLRFSRAAPHARLGWLLLALGLVAYPVLGYAFGQRYPASPTFGLPCPTTIFTLGLLQFARRVPASVYAVPVLWTAIGASAAFQLGVRQDLLLLVAGAAALYALRSRSGAAGTPRAR